MDFKTNRNIVYACIYHVVFCPKYRRKVPVHMYLLLGLDPQFGIHRLVRFVKGRSSRVLWHEFPWLKNCLPSLWTNAYFCSTTGSAPLAKMKQNIESQKRSER